MPAARPTQGLALAVAAALALAACGSGGHASSRAGASSSAAGPAGAGTSTPGTSSTAGATSTPGGAPGATSTPGTTSTPGGARAKGRFVLPSPGPTGKPPSAASVRVIRAWSDTLRRGDVRAAGRYFALPSEMINGPNTNGLVSVIHIRTRLDAAAANATLPCGARLLSTDQRGIYVNALFALTSRPGLGGGCQGATGTGRVNFVFRRGLIARWIRARDEPGDSSRGATGGSAGGAPPPASTGVSPSTPVA